MKVILLKDIARIGKKNEIKEVPDGHALNFLIPRKLAEQANAKNLSRVSVFVANESTRENDKEGQFKNLVEKLKQNTSAMEVDANEKGHLFKGIHQKDIAEHFGSIVGSEIEQDIILLSDPIKEVGEHEVILTHKDIRVPVTLHVTSK